MSAATNKDFVLTEWDFDMPRNNRFHDPLNQQESCDVSRQSDGEKFDIQCTEETR